jgi:flagellar basal-body rod protein FlgG
MQAQQMRINTIANNLSNVNTTGYKKSSVDFQDLLYQTITEPSRDNAGTQYGLGVKPVAITKAYSQGNLQITNNPYNCAINGSGFFQVRQPDGTFAYTRDGSFKLSPEGYLTTANGLIMEPQIQIDPRALDVTVNSDGMVYVKLANATELNQVGQITITRFANPAGLEAIGDNLLMQTGASGEPQTGVPGTGGLGVLRQGALEASNVELVQEMVMMIATQKAYDTSSKAITVSDKMMDTANQLIR